jgi:IS5 family transposase
MKIFEEFKIRFEDPNWKNDPQLGLVDSVLEKHPHLFNILKDDIIGPEKPSRFGRKDTPSIEQIVRAAIYKELKGLDYRELAYHQEDSRICEHFVKIDVLRPYSHQVYQKFISRIKAENLQYLLVELNKIAINEGLEDLSRLRQDTSTVESDIHYPTNNSLIWDCIKEAHNNLEKLSQEVDGVSFRDYTKGAKKTFFKLNMANSKDKKTALFQKQLTTFTKSINQVSNVIKKKENYASIKAVAIIASLEKLLPVMKQVYDISWRKEINGEQVPNKDKIFSIYEQHTDIIVKGGRKSQFGHKINLATGKSNLVLHCEVLKGNPSDGKLHSPTLDSVIENYGQGPRDIASDGCYANVSNLRHAQNQGVVNVVFNKITNSLKNQVSSQNMETRLKKWRSGIEANISNIKRGFKLQRCIWKGWAHFQAKVLWSVIAYNIRVMTQLMLARLL